jgi:hypothetical protein
MMELLNAVFTLHLAHEQHERDKQHLKVRDVRAAARHRFAADPCPDTYAADHPWREAA